jgi:fumarate hydratase subunit beta
LQKKIKLPLTDDIVQDLHAGDNVLLTGTIYVARDSAHKRMVEALDKGQNLPFDIKDQTIYYMGPSPAKPGQVIGAAGPTTSGRMDSFSPRLMQEGLKGMIGKGNRSKAVKEAIVKNKAVYFAASVVPSLIAKGIRYRVLL